MTDSIATVYVILMYWQMLCQEVMYHLFVIVAVGSLLPMADVISTFESLCLADVIARWLVLLSLYIQSMFWQMLLQRWLMECPLQQLQISGTLPPGITPANTLTSNKL